MTNPIVEAVSPLKNSAMDRAEQHANSLINRVKKELEIGGWDLNAVAPYPRAWGASKKSYAEARSRNAMFWALVVPAGEQASRITGKPYIVKLSDTKIQKFVDSARKDAAEQYDSFVAKLVSKIGEVEKASLIGDHVWSHSILVVSKRDGSVERWKTQMIINVSKLGNLFNQWPTRKVK